MNLILLTENDFTGPSPAARSGSVAAALRLDGRRHAHVRDVLRAKVGDSLRVGLLGGRIGEGVVTAIDETGVELEVSLDREPPAPLPLTLFLALPRPKAIPRVLQMATSLGIKQIYLINAFRVEKIYWSCDQLSDESVREACLLGLEQARDTVMPEIRQCRLFKPFVEDELPALIAGSEALVAHPGASEACPYRVERPVSLAVGPEGGFIEYELKLLEHAGFRTVRTLDRILKVETAVASLVGRLV